MQAIYISSTQFKVSTDKTEEFLAGRRIRALCGLDYKYSTVYSSVYSSPYTTITIEETILTSNLTEVHYGIINIGEQGSFPKHSHDGSEGTGGLLSLLNLSDTPDVYEEGEYLRATTSGVEFAVPDDRYYTETELDNGQLDSRYYTESEVDTISGTLQTNIDGKPDTEVFLVEGDPLGTIGKKDDIAIDQETGNIHERTFDPLIVVTWNPLDKHDDISLSNGNLTATVTVSVWRGVRSTLGKTIGKWYWENTVDVGTGSYHTSIGVGTLGALLDHYVGYTGGHSYGYRGGNGKKYYNGVSYNYGSLYETGDIIGVALDLDAGKIWWSKNGVWQASGDPGAGTNEAYSGLSGTFFPMYAADTSSHKVTANFGATDFSYTVPTGFIAGLIDCIIWEKKLSPDFLKLSDTPGSYDEGKYLKTTSSGIDFVEDLYTKSEVDTISGSLQINIDGKSDTGHTHDDRYYTESEIDTISGSLQTSIDGKADTVHTHDDRYYTESEVDTISGSLQTNIDDKIVWHLTEGVPATVLGKAGDLALDQLVGTIYEKGAGGGDTSTTFYVGDTTDDGRFRVSYYNNSLNYSTFGNYYSQYWNGFFRFPNISVQKDSTIINAFVRFTASSNNAGTCHLNVYFNEVDNAVAPSNETEAFALVLTDPTAWNNVPNWTYGNTYDTVDISTVLQEIVNRPGWSSGNAVQIIVNDNGGTSGVVRDCNTFGHASGGGVELHITYSSIALWEEKLSPDFLKLSDTPTTYSGVSGKYLKTTTSGIEFSDDELYTKSEVDTISGSLQTNIDGKSDTGHTHDDRYYTESEVDTISGTLQTSIDSMPVTFLELTDTPTTYSGVVGNYVKTTSSGIEFSDDYHFGDDTNYTQIETDGKIHFFGDAQPVNFAVIDSLMCDASHLAPLSMISLAASNGILTSDLDTSAGSSRRIEVIGVDGGMYVKGRNKGAYTQGDTTHESYRVKIKLNTTNAVWEQSGEWKIILDILSGDITGDFTVYMPPFSIMEYDSLEVYVTVDGATYAEITSRGFDVSVSGPVAAEELFSNNETTGSGIVVEVASTAGFYVGNEVFVSDSSNSEWVRIEEVVEDTSITVDLSNSYTTVSGAKFNIFDYVKTTLTEPIQRGLFRTKIFKASENSGIQFQMPVPQQTDPTKDLGVVLQYVSTADNPGSSLVSKWRVQYFFKTLGEDIPESYQYAELVYADVTPPVTKCNYIATLATITPEAHQGKNLLAMQVTRLGADSGDTYTGNFKLAAVIVNMPWKQLGYEA